MPGAVGRPGMDEMRWHGASAVLLYFLIRIQRKLLSSSRASKKMAASKSVVVGQLACCSVKDWLRTVLRGRLYQRRRASDRKGRWSAWNAIAAAARGVVIRVLRACVMRSKGSQKAKRKRDQSSAGGRAVNEAGRRQLWTRPNETVGARSATMQAAIWLPRAKLQPRSAQLKRPPWLSPNAGTADNGASIAGFQFRFHRRPSAHLGLPDGPPGLGPTPSEPSGERPAPLTRRGARRGAGRGAGRGSPG